MNFRIVEQHVDLAGHDDGVIHRARAVHGWMARRQSALGRAVAKALVHAVGIELARFERFRRKIDDAKDRAAARRHDTDIDRSTVGACGRTFLCGLAPSSSTTALSLLSMVVTTRRTSALKAMMAFPPAFARALAAPIIPCRRDVVG